MATLVMWGVTIFLIVTWLALLRVLSLHRRIRREGEGNPGRGLPLEVPSLPLSHPRAEGGGGEEEEVMIA